MGGSSVTQTSPNRSAGDACRDDSREADQSGGVPGGDADTPTDIPAKGWLQIVNRGWAERKRIRCRCWGRGWPSTPSSPSSQP